MSKRSVFTTITPLPTEISREVVMATLRNHVEMIDLNPLVFERHKLDKAPSHASAEEYNAIWYEITDKVSYLPVPGASSKVTYTGCFHDLPTGLQTHVFAPLGVEIRSRWTLGGSLPGEPSQPSELGLGIPKTGLYLREDVDLRCNLVFSSFVKKTLKKSHETLKERLVEKTKIESVDVSNASLADSYHRTQQMHTFDTTSSNYGNGLSSISPSLNSAHTTGVSPDQHYVDPVYAQQSASQVPAPLFSGQQATSYSRFQQQPGAIPSHAPPKDSRGNTVTGVAELPATAVEWNPNRQRPLELPS